MTLSAHQMLDVWDQEQDHINQLEDALDEAIDRMIKDRPADYRRRFDDEGFEVATRTYIGFIEAVGSLRSALREMRSVKTRFTGQIADPGGAAMQLYSTVQHVTREIHGFVDLYTKKR